jgi:hypothetical protein
MPLSREFFGAEKNQYRLYILALDRFLVWMVFAVLLDVSEFLSNNKWFILALKF